MAVAEFARWTYGAFTSSCWVLEFLEIVGPGVGILQAELDGRDGPEPQAQVIFMLVTDQVAASNGIYLMARTQVNSDPFRPG